MKNLEKLKQNFAYAQSIKKEKELELNILNDYCFKLDLQLQDLKNNCYIYTIRTTANEIGKVICEKNTELKDCYVKEASFSKKMLEDTINEYTNEYTRDCSVVEVIKIEEIK